MLRAINENIRNKSNTKNSCNNEIVFIVINISSSVDVSCIHLVNINVKQVFLSKPISVIFNVDL